MTDDDPPHPAPTRPVLSERERRLAAALRENLKRRKAQSRERAQPPEDPRPAPGDGPGGKED